MSCPLVTDLNSKLVLRLGVSTACPGNNENLCVHNIGLAFNPKKRRNENTIFDINSNTC